MSTVPSREPAKRVFARELSDATEQFRESDDERAPVYSLLPTGDRVNRLLAIGVLTDAEDVGTDDEYWHGRISGPTGTFHVYAGNYQPDCMAALRQIDTPAFVAVVGKPKTFEGDDGIKRVSIRPEAITVVEESDRQKWVLETAEQTLDRIERFSDRTAPYVDKVESDYGDDVSLDDYTQMAIEALEFAHPEMDTESNESAPA